MIKAIATALLLFLTWVSPVWASTLPHQNSSSAAAKVNRAPAAPKQPSPKSNPQSLDALSDRINQRVSDQQQKSGLDLPVEVKFKQGVQVRLKRKLPQ